jgi:Na+-translocating ferredoxin:NAD+ oxidoreductase RnfG subunit
VDAVLLGTVGALGATTLINLERVSVATGGTDAAAYREVTGADGLSAAVDGLLTDLLVDQTDGTDAETAKRVVQRYQGQLRYCYEHELKANLGLAGRIRLGWQVLPSGRTHEVRVVSDETGWPALGACMEKRVSSWLFPVGMAGEMVWPFVFAPEGAAPAGDERAP